MTLGFEVFVQLVMAAISTLPWRRSPSRRGAGAATGSGVDRLLAISRSVAGLVSRAAALCGDTQAWLPPPA